MWSWVTKRFAPGLSKIERASFDETSINTSLPIGEAHAVRIHNNDVAPMGFVVQALEAAFGLNHEEAVRFMIHVHTRGSADIGRMSRARAENVVASILELTQRHQQPLACEVVQCDS